MRIRFNITSKLTLVIVLFSALLLIVVSTLAYTNGRSALEAATLAELNSASFEKQSALNDWIAEKEAEVNAFARWPQLQADVANLTAANATKDQAKARAAHDRIIADLQPWVGPEEDIQGWIVMDPGSAQVIAATNASQEDKFREDQAYFINGKNGIFAQNPYYSLDAQSVMFTVAAPIHSADGRLVGVLAGHLDLNKVNEVIGRRTGVRQSDDAYLVNTSELFVTQPRFEKDPAVLQRGVHTEGVKRCLTTHSNGVVTTQDYRGILSYMVYQWLPERQLCLIVKMDQAEALAPVITLGNTILLTSILALLVASALAFWLARTITRPVQTLKFGVESFGQGKLDVRISETSQDELGRLAHEFNRMADSLSKKDAEIHAYALNLEQKVDERTAQLATSQERYQTVADFTYDWEYWNAPTGEMLYVSPSCERITGYRPEEFVENPDLMDGIVYPDDRQILEEHKAQVWNNINDGRVHVADFRIVRRDGEVRWIGHTCQSIHRPDGMDLGQRATNRDITERKIAEERIRKLNRVLSVLSDTNQAIVRIRDTSRLFESVCRMAVEKGGFVLVWIGLVDPATEKIMPAAYSGNSNGYLEKLVSALNDHSQGQNPILGMLLNGQRCLCNDLENDSLLAFLRPEIDRLGFHSAVALPLKVAGVWRGLINLYSSEPDFFDDDELKLLDEMTMDLSYSMEFTNQEAERRRAEEAVKKSEELYRTLVAQASDGIFLADRDGRYIEVNSAGSRMLGYTREELLQLNMRDLTKHSQEEPLRFKELQDGKTLLSEREMVRKDGTLLSVEISARQLPDGRLQGIVRDITERKQAVAALRDSEERQSAFFASGVTGTLFGDVFGNIKQANDEFLRIIGYSREELNAGKVRWTDLTPPEFLPLDEIAITQAKDQGSCTPFEKQYIRKDGTRVWVLIGFVLVGPLKDDSIAFILDLTDLKQKEAEIQKLNAELEQRVVHRTQQLEAANKELEAFAYSVSHDLRAPLRAIDGFSRIIVDDYADKLDSEGNRLLNVIRTNTAKMDLLITALLALSKTTRIEMKFSRVDMATLANSIYHEVSSPEVREHMIFSVLALPDAQGDPNLLRQVWTNLLSNAIKYTVPKGERRIEVGGYRENDMNVYYVKDNGVGFNPEYTHKLFGVFQRLHKSEDFEGTGVGLAIVQRIIQRHGGKVWAEGQLNQGATFYFTLQAVDESQSDWVGETL